MVNSVLAFLRLWRNKLTQVNTTVKYPPAACWNATTTNDVTSAKIDIPASGYPENTNLIYWVDDCLEESLGDWRQDLTKITYANGTAYITRQFNITNNGGVNLTNVNVTANVTARPGWVCTGITSVTVLTGPNSWNYSINCTKDNVVYSVFDRIGKVSGYWLQNVTVTNTDPAISFLTYINTTFLSIGSPQLWVENSTGYYNITSIAWFNDTDSDTYYEYAQWNYTIPYNSSLNFTVNGTRTASITASLSATRIYSDQSATVSGIARYMDNDTFSPVIIHVLVNYPRKEIQTHNVSVSANGTFSKTISGLVPGTYKIYVSGVDVDNISATTGMLTLYVYYRPPTSSISLLPLPPPPRAEITISSLAPGVIKRFDIEESGTGLVSISLSVKTRVTDAKIKVEKLTTIEETKPTGKVYSYLKITTQNLGDDALEEVKIKFKVERTWIEENEVDEERIVLMRLEGGNWRELPTTLLSSDENYVYYEATTPGFSYFAIGEKVAEEEMTTTTTVPPTTTTTTIPPKTTTTITPPTPEEEGVIPYTWIVVATAVGIVAISLFFLKKSGYW